MLDVAPRDRERQDHRMLLRGNSKQPAQNSTVNQVRSSHHLDSSLLGLLHLVGSLRSKTVPFEICNEDSLPTPFDGSVSLRRFVDF